MSRLAPLLVALTALAVLLGACGGGGGSSSPSTASPAAVRAPETPAQAAAERRRAGRAAPFVSADADNSVPTYGSEAGATQRVGAERALQTYLLARQAEDWSKACRNLATSTRRGFLKLARSSGKKATSCALVLPVLSKRADLTDPLTDGLLSLRVDGPNAFALFYGPGRRQYIVPMHRDGSTWRPTQTAPIPYPPGVTPTPEP
jgi:hypothetical protein